MMGKNYRALDLESWDDLKKVIDVLADKIDFRDQSYGLFCNNIAKTAAILIEEDDSTDLFDLILSKLSTQH